MIKIIINDHTIEDEPEFAHNLDAELSVQDEATVEDCLYMFIRAMKIAGYTDTAINKQIVTAANYIKEELYTCTRGDEK